MRLVAFFAILAGAAFGATIAHDPSPSEIDDIIAKFAAKEAAFAAGARATTPTARRQRHVAG